MVSSNLPNDKRVIVVSEAEKWGVYKENKDGEYYTVLEGMQKDEALQSVDYIEPDDAVCVVTRKNGGFYIRKTVGACVCFERSADYIRMLRSGVYYLEDKFGCIWDMATGYRVDFVKLFQERLNSERLGDVVVVGVEVQMPRKLTNFEYCPVALKFANGEVIDLCMYVAGDNKMRMAPFAYVQKLGEQIDFSESADAMSVVEMIGRLVGMRHLMDAIGNECKMLVEQRRHGQIASESYMLKMVMGVDK